MDESTINELYKIGALTKRGVRRINIVQGLRDGLRITTIARRFNVSKQAVYRIKAALLHKGVL